MKGKLSWLKSEGGTRVANDLAEAHKKGDSSENTEYDAVTDAQGSLETNIAALETLVANARVLKESEVDLFRVSLKHGLGIKK